MVLEFSTTPADRMGIIKLTEGDIIILQKLAPDLKYNSYKNIIHGSLSFDLQFGEDGRHIKDKYEIEIDLNRNEHGVPVVRETEKKIRNIAIQKGIKLVDMHINANDEMCLIIPPKIEEKYPNGFDLERLIYHIQEHLYYISHVERFNSEPWKAYNHGDEGYLDLYLEDRDKYSEVFKCYFQCSSRPDFRRKLKELRKAYKK